MELRAYFDKFISSGIAAQFQKGNPKYVAGMTGCELTREVMAKSGVALERIHRAVSMLDIIRMYPTLHEADITKFISVMDEKLGQYYTETNLKRARVAAGLSQSELAELSGINIRQIQMFEQGHRDINKTQVMNAIRLARALGCHVEDIVEI